jgi:hypothetical protein
MKEGKAFKHKLDFPHKSGTNDLDYVSYNFHPSKLSSFNSLSSTSFLQLPSINTFFLQLPSFNFLRQLPSIISHSGL